MNGAGRARVGELLDRSSMSDRHFGVSFYTRNGYVVYIPLSLGMEQEYRDCRVFDKIVYHIFRLVAFERGEFDTIGL